MSYRVLKASTTKSKGINMKKEIYIYIYILYCIKHLTKDEKNFK